MTHICVVKLTIIGSDNGLSPGRHQAIIWTNAGILLIEPLGTNFSEINFNWNSNIFIQENALENVVCEMASIFSRPQCVKQYRRAAIAMLGMIMSEPLEPSFVLHAKWQIFFKPFDIDRDISWYVLVFCDVNLWSDRHWAVVFYLAVFNWLWHNPGAL